MKTSMYVIFLAVLLMVVSGCNNRAKELEIQNAALNSVNSHLNQDLLARDEYIATVTDSINAVYVSIENLKSKEASLLKEKTDLESSKKLSQAEVRERLGDRIGVIRATLSNDHKRILDLQAKLAHSKKQYAGLQKLVENLKTTLAERDQSIAELTGRIQGLEQDVAQKNQMITEKNTLISEKDALISDQKNQLTTSYYITGTRDELEKKGIIKDEGGFPWGLFGSTSVLASGFDLGHFEPINNTTVSTIQIDAKIDEIIPKRDASFYQHAKLATDKSTLTISNPEKFWKEKYLVIITDRPSRGTVLSDMAPTGQ
jgi:uncharacterized coiled-coil protein SlyX